MLVADFFKKCEWRMFQKHNFSKYKLISSSLQFSVYLLAQINTQKMKSSIKNFFSKCEHIRIKLRIYSHLLNKSLTENIFFFAVNVIDLTNESFKFIFKPNCQSLVYFPSINTWHKLVSSLLFRNKFLALSVNNSTFTLAGA